jgi:hypothetical protein
MAKKFQYNNGSPEEVTTDEISDDIEDEDDEE